MVELPATPHPDSKSEGPAAAAHGSADVKLAGPAPAAPKVVEVKPVAEPKERVHA
jgi:hypothetical protein